MGRQHNVVCRIISITPDHTYIQKPLKYGKHPDPAQIGDCYRAKGWVQDQPKVEKVFAEYDFGNSSTRFELKREGKMWRGAMTVTNGLCIVNLTQGFKTAKGYSYGLTATFEPRQEPIQDSLFG